MATVRNATYLWAIVAKMSVSSLVSVCNPGHNADDSFAVSWTM